MCIYRVRQIYLQIHVQTNIYLSRKCRAIQVAQIAAKSGKNNSGLFWEWAIVLSARLEASNKNVLSDLVGDIVNTISTALDVGIS